MTLDPARARPRPDLGFLTVRSSRTPPPPAAPAAPAVPAAPLRSGSSLLDLDDAPGPASTPTPVSAASSVLDLDALPSAAPTAPTVAARSSRTALPSLPGRRLPETSGRVLLAPATPSVVLSRVASGIGTLTIEAAISPELGDVHVGCAYQLASGLSSFLNVDSGKPTAPQGAMLPVLVGSRGRFGRIAVDLRQIHDVERLLVVVHSASRTPVHWNGTLVITTHAGARVEAPLDAATDGVALAAVSLYQVRGEIALRTELDSADSVRSACVAFGYDSIAWLDDRSPVS
ncbi:hypothetical protein [Nocardioides sp. Kera G14]|uniref:hypothetical protein n=1 Tax=Nocardioides sp. Kera G14 TaxID=2884264 RepID=UPI001D11F8FF|nr:hypothetical protein [Nocardioides sp. Kera G14]UDY23242.1 hypothetical protein LH076_14410 [Nocardioides sp. Kera G14]